MSRTTWRNALQTLIVFRLFVFVACVTHEPNWIGKAPEVLALLLWAFGVDLTVSLLLSGAKKVPAIKTRLG